MKNAHDRMTQNGTLESAGTAPAAMSASRMMPIDFCASLVPCARETSDAEPTWPQRNARVETSSGTSRVRRATSHVPTLATPIATSGASSAGMSTFAATPVQMTPDVPTAASTEPTTPPMRACDELDGRPRSHVSRFHVMPPTRPASTTSSVMTFASTRPLAMVAATASDRKAPTMLRTADRATAVLGLRARVAMEVAIALPVSWKPLVKSKARAVTTTSTSRIVSVTSSMVGARRAPSRPSCGFFCHCSPTVHPAFEASVRTPGPGSGDDGTMALTGPSPTPRDGRPEPADGRSSAVARGAGRRRDAAHRLDGVGVVVGLGVKGAVDRHALDEGVQQARGRRVEVPREGAPARRHPPVRQAALGRVMRRQRVELVGQHEVARGGEDVPGDDLHDRVDRLLPVLRRLQAVLEPRGGRVGEPAERLAQQLVDAREVVGHGAERHVGGGGHLPVGRAGDAPLGDDVEARVDDPVAAVRVGPSRPVRPSPLLGAHPSMFSRITRAGLPTATTFAGRSRVTTAPAPTTVFSPMLTPGHTTTPPPSHTLSPIVIGAAPSHFSRRGPGSTGWVGVSSCTFGPICTSSPIVTVATSRLSSPKLAKLLAPKKVW